MTKSETKGSYWGSHCCQREHFPANSPSETSVVPTPSESLFRGRLGHSLPCEP